MIQEVFLLGDRAEMTLRGNWSVQSSGAARIPPHFWERGQPPSDYPVSLILELGDAVPKVGML